MPNDPSSGIVGLRGSRCHIPHVPARRTDNPPVGRLPNCSRRHQRRCVLAPFRRRLRPHRHADTSASRRTARLKSTTVNCKNNASQKGWELEKPHRSSSDHEPVMSIAWFPAGEWTEARRRWTDLQEQGLPADQCRVQQGPRVKHPASVARCRTQPPRRAPIIVDVLEGYSRRHGLDPNTAEARAHFAAEVTRLGQTLDWPPRRSEPCWCGSGLKYKRCCATAPDDRV